MMLWCLLLVGRSTFRLYIDDESSVDMICMNCGERIRLSLNPGLALEVIPRARLHDRTCLIKQSQAWRKSERK